MSTCLTHVIAMLAALAPAGVEPTRDHENPVQRRVQTDYSCRDGERSFTLVYEGQASPILRSALRRGVPLGTDGLEVANRAIGRLDGVSNVTPQCAEGNDLLIVVGSVGQRRSAVFLSWSDQGMEATGPVPIGF